MSHIQGAVREYVSIVGQSHTDCQWILSPYDSWEKNPCYNGPDQRHPEEDSYYDDEEEVDYCDF